MTTLAAIKAAVAVKLGETSDDGMLSELTTTVNSGLTQMATEYDWPWLIRSTTFPTVVGQDTYALPANCTRIRTLAIGSDVLQTRTYEDLVVFDGYQSTPAFFMVEGDSIVFAPAPNAVVTVKCKYVIAEAVLVDDEDEPFVPDWYADLAVVYIALEEARRRRDQVLVSLLEQSRTQWIKRINDNLQRSKDMPEIRTRTDFD